MSSPSPYPFHPVGTIHGMPAHGGWSAAFKAPNGQPFIITAPDAELLRSACASMGLKLDMPHEMHGVMILDRRMVAASDVFVPAPIEEVKHSPAVDEDPMPHGHQDISDVIPVPASAAEKGCGKKDCGEAGAPMCSELCGNIPATTPAARNEIEDY